jgi:hypothetical protein
MVKMTRKNLSDHTNAMTASGHEQTKRDLRIESASPRIVLQKSFCTAVQKFSGL